MMHNKYKTKFPVARIKKIMQLDDDVGKVAQATPVLISKALELFMQLLLDEAAREARERGCRRIVPGHMKEAIIKIDHFDFLREHVESVPGLVAASTSASSGSESAPVEEAPQKRRRCACFLPVDEQQTINARDTDRARP